MKTNKYTFLLASTALLTCILFALYFYFNFSNDGIMRIDGAPVSGFAGAGYAVGGTLFALLVIFSTLIFIGLVVAGVSLFVMAIFALVFFALVVLLSPLLLPLMIFVGLVMFFSRRKRLVINSVS